MLSIIFFFIAVPFVVLLYRAIRTGEILARGWGFETRVYSRDGEPIRYWVTFVSYAICALVAALAAVLLL
jgi:ribose/xylose/arabinose/galactoside ABC-type transport system permease subunit